jgi:hypothetical protein
MSDATIFFRHERELRCRAARARDLAASAEDPAERRAHLAEAARHAQAVQTSLNEQLLIRR